MAEAKKRKRWTKARHDRYWSTRMKIVHLFREAQKQGTGMSNAFDAAMQAIADADLLHRQAGSLTDFAWGIREFVVQEQADWQLFVDGAPKTSEEISSMRAAGDEDVWRRVHGMHVWRCHRPALKSFYATDDTPKPV